MREIAFALENQYPYYYMGGSSTCLIRGYTGEYVPDDV